MIDGINNDITPAGGATKVDNGDGITFGGASDTLTFTAMGTPGTAVTTLAGIEGFAGNGGILIFDIGTKSLVFTGNIGGTNALTSLTLTSGTIDLGTNKIGAATLTTAAGSTLRASDLSGVTTSSRIAGTHEITGTGVDLGTLYQLDGGTLKVGRRNATSASGITLLADSTIDTSTFDLALSGVISGSSALTKDGTGILTLSGVNTYNGATIVNAGTLHVTDTGSIAFSQAAGGVALAAGTTLRFDAAQLAGLAGITATAPLAPATKFATVQLVRGSGIVSIGAFDLSSSNYNVYVGADDSDPLGPRPILFTGEWTGQTNVAYALSDEKLVLGVDAFGRPATLVHTTAPTSPTLGYTNIDLSVVKPANLNKLGDHTASQVNNGQQSGWIVVGTTDVTKADTDAQKGAFFVGKTAAVGGTSSYLTPRYKMNLLYTDDASTNGYESYFGTGANAFGLGSGYVLTSEQAVALPDTSSLVLMSIIGLELPRAQAINGPWARFKGGAINDNMAMFDKGSYQSLQLGWDKVIEAVSGNGSWVAGGFLEGDWMYGDGTYRAWGQEDFGKLKSSTKGLGAGLYLSRIFRNGLYFDLVGRNNNFDNKANMIANDSRRDYDYSAKWASDMFSMGFEVGKTFTSSDKCLSLSIYDRVIYTTMSSQEFSANYSDGSRIDVNNHGVSAWTNRLGTKLSRNNYNHGQLTSLFFISADYYRGLAGDFGMTAYDPTLEQVVRTNVARTKNDLNYGTTGGGISLLPRDNVMLTFSGDKLFGDVKGYSVTFMSSISF